MDKKMINIRVTLEDKEKLQTEAKNQRRSLSSFILWLFDQWSKKRENK